MTINLRSCNVLVSSTAGIYKNTVNKKNVMDIFKVAQVTTLRFYDAQREVSLIDCFILNPRFFDKS